MSRKSKIKIEAFRPHSALAWVLVPLLASCAASGERQAGPQARVPQAWVAGVPVVASETRSTSPNWWSGFGDPLLLQLQAAAVQASPDLASARTRLERARADRVAAGAVLTPVVNAVAAGQRSRTDKITPITNTRSGGFQASWELDLFGAARAGRDAQQALLEGSQAALQGVRIAVAADAALSYVSLRSCEAQQAESELDARSRAETARVSESAAQAGFLSSGESATARAGAAQARALAIAQRARCDKLVKALVALTDQDEASLRAALAPGYARIPVPASVAVDTLPAALLTQRLDLRQAELNVAAAVAETRAADARRWPTVGLSGTIGSLRVSSDAGRLEGRTWTLGPLQVTFPVFDGGVRRANQAVARAAYDEAIVVYQARVRQAVREVEEALVEVGSLQARASDVRQAAEDYAAALAAADTRFRTGLSSVFELEDARRNASGSRLALVDLARDQALGAIALYRALGGGWPEPAEAPPPPPRATEPSPEPNAPV